VPLPCAALGVIGLSGRAQNRGGYGTKLLNQEQNLKRRKKVKKIISLLLVIALCIPVVLGACGEEAPTPAPSPAPKPMKQIVHKMAQYMVPTHPCSMIPKIAFDAVEELTNGRVKVETYCSSELCSANETLSFVQEGRIEAGYFYPGYISKTLPLFDAWSLPMMFDDYWTAVLALQMLTPLLQNELNDKGYNVLALAWGHEGTNMVYNRDKVVRVPSDIKGMVLRSHSDVSNEGVKLCGASPAMIDTAEGYEALARGLIDGGWFASPHPVALKWYEVLHNCLLMPIYRNYCGIIWNRDAWNELPDDCKAIVKQQAEFYRMNRAFYMAAEEPREMTWLGSPEGGGITYTQPTESEVELWRTTLDPVKDIWLAKAGPRGPEALRIMEEAKEVADESYAVIEEVRAKYR